MTGPSEEGGDPACWLHLFEEPPDAAPGEADGDPAADDPSAPAPPDGSGDGGEP